jgi:hypothetical protein
MQRTGPQLITTVPEVHGSNYQLFAEIINCQHPPDTVCLRFGTRWTGARDPQALQIKAEFFLDSDAQARLADLLRSQGHQ